MDSDNVFMICAAVVLCVAAVMIGFFQMKQLELNNKIQVECIKSGGTFTAGSNNQIQCIMPGVRIQSPAEAK